jgi:hypothetical protein
MLQLHAAFPLHCLVGGGATRSATSCVSGPVMTSLFCSPVGDQLYNDPVFQQPALKSWGEMAEL